MEGWIAIGGQLKAQIYFQLQYLHKLYNALICEYVRILHMNYLLILNSKKNENAVCVPFNIPIGFLFFLVELSWNSYWFFMEFLLIFLGGIPIEFWFVFLLIFKASNPTEKTVFRLISKAKSIATEKCLSDWKKLSGES